MRDVVLVGGGKSIKEGLDLGLWDHIKHLEVWSLNFAYRTMPYLPTRELWVDNAFFTRNADDLQRLWKQGVRLVAQKNMRYALVNHALGEAITQYDVARVPAGFQGVGALRNPGCLIFSGRMGFVGIFALSLALAEGVERTFLLGFDWGTPNHSDKFTHYYQDTLKEIVSSGLGNTEIYLDKDGNPKPDVKEFELHRKAADENNLKIYNVSMQSHIQAFDKLSYPQFFEMIGTQV